jgi:hypothetical protein
MAKRDHYKVTVLNVARIFKALKAAASEGEGYMTVSELARRSGLHKWTVSRTLDLYMQNLLDVFIPSELEAIGLQGSRHDQRAAHKIFKSPEETKPMKLTKQVVFTLFIGVMMITWAMGIALSYNIQTNNQGMQIQSVYEELLTPLEEVTILRTGRVLIKLLHTGTADGMLKKAEYENFVARFDGFAVLEVVEISDANMTRDEMITPTGDVLPLDNVTGEALINLFCDNTFAQPRDCLLMNV